MKLVSARIEGYEEACICTPGGVQIKEGDTAECRIDGFEPLVNPVGDLKNLSN